MLWLKSFHVIFMVTWFAGLFYLPRIFVYHSMNTDDAVDKVFKVMERRLLIMMHIGGTLTWLFGLALVVRAPFLLEYGWLHTKLLLVVLVTGYHFWCMHLVKVFAENRNTRSDKWYRWFNEAPTLALLGIVILAIVKPAF